MPAAPMPNCRKEAEPSLPRVTLDIGFIATVKGLMLVTFTRAVGPMHRQIGHEQRSDPFELVASAPGNK